MMLDKISQQLAHIPYMSPEKGTVVYNFILNNPISDVLELGTAHGTGACYMAAALQEKKVGLVTTIDRLAAKYSPDVFELRNRCGLQDFINPVRSRSSYTWELLKLIEQQTKNGCCIPKFDFCYIDGAHNFEIDTCAFFLVDKLLRPGGYVLFDDLNWTYAKSPALKDSDWVMNMPDDEKNTPHIRKLVELIVMNQPGYADFSFLGDWFMARKRGGAIAQDAASLESYKSTPTILQRLQRRVRQLVK